MWGRQPPAPPAPPPEESPAVMSSSPSSSTPLPPPTTTSPNGSTTTTPTPARPLPSELYYYATPPRLHMPLFSRLLIANFFASSAGFLLGAGIGSRKASLRFRAENAHRFPRSKKGWYFYHKSKNWYVMLASVKEGVYSAGRLAGITSLFFCVEEVVDDVRGGRVDAVGSIVAGGVTGGVYGYLGHVTRGVVAKTAKRGAWLGLLYGAAQDFVRVLAGESVFYLDPLVRRISPSHGRGEGDSL